MHTLTSITLAAARHTVPSCTSSSVVFRRSFQLLLPVFLTKGRDWFCNTDTDWRHFILELGKIDVPDFRTEISSIQQYYKVTSASGVMLSATASTRITNVFGLSSRLLVDPCVFRKLLLPRKRKGFSFSMSLCFQLCVIIAACSLWHYLLSHCYTAGL